MAFGARSLDKRVMLLCAVYFAIVVGLYGIGYWLPQIVQGMGFSNFAIGLLVALPYAAAGAAQFLWGRHSDNSGERIWHVALPSLMSAVAFALSAVLAAPFFVLIALAFAAIGICATLAPFWAMPPQFLSGRGAAAGIAAINAVGNLGGFIGPYAVGWALAVTGSYAGGMLILALSLLAGAGLVLAMATLQARDACRGLTINPAVLPRKRSGPPLEDPCSPPYPCCILRWTEPGFKGLQRRTR